MVIIVITALITISAQREKQTNQYQMNPWDTSSLMFAYFHSWLPESVIKHSTFCIGILLTVGLITRFL